MTGILVRDHTPASRSSLVTLLSEQETVVNARERRLLLLTGLFISVNWLALLLVRGADVLSAWPLLVWIGCGVVGHSVLRRELPRRDPFLFPLAVLLAGWGLVEIERLSSIFAARQAVWLALSTAALIGLLHLPRDLRWLSRYRYVWLAIGLAALIGAVLLRSNPVDLVKLSLLAFVASYLAETRDLLDAQAVRIGPLRIPSPRHLLPLVAMWGLSAVILVVEHAFGMAVLYLIVMLLLLYVATGRVIYITGGGLLLVVVGVVAYAFYGVARQRFDIWLNPWVNADGSAYQIVQSLIAVASGGVFGQGIGQGAPVYIPIAHSDFIFASIGEEWGLFGALALVGCQALLCVRAVRTGIGQSQPFRALLAVGIGLTFAVQSMLIMAGTLNLIPLTGITLPLVSYGGSSLISSYVLIGLLLIIGSGN